MDILSKDVEIVGTINFTGELVIDGKVEGEIFSHGLLTVGANAEITCNVKTKSIIVLGKVTGNVTVEERCELRAGSHLHGGLKAARLVIEDGATFVGTTEVGAGKGDSAKAAPKKAA